MTRLATAIVVVLALAGVAGADHALVKQYAGQIVISPDPVPTEASELAVFVKQNITKDGRYALIKGSPWQINLVGFLTKDSSTAGIDLVFSDAADPKHTVLHSIPVSSKRRVVISKATATTAAGFETGKTYRLRLMRGNVSLAKAELTLRD
jgi:hypothetical protein